MTALDHPEFTRWRTQADRALRTALLAVEGQPEWACFLAEQAAQLAVKGLLHAVGEAAWGHDLVVLERSVVAAVAPSWPNPTADEAARLSRHYIPTRYPDAHATGPPGDHYRRTDAEGAIADARGLLAAVDGAWNALLGAEREDEGDTETRDGGEAP